MPVIIIVCILAVYGIRGIYNALTPNTRAFTSKELEQISKEMIGKSQSECRKILKKWR